MNAVDLPTCRLVDCGQGGQESTQGGHSYDSGGHHGRLPKWQGRIHPFEDGNGRTARLLSGYILDRYGYGFGGIGSLEEYFAYNLGEYDQFLQMFLPALYYSGRCNPPHPEIWFHYFLRMVELYAKKGL